MADHALPHSDAPAPARRFRFKAFLPKSLLGRSLLIILTPLIILQLVTATVFYDRPSRLLGKNAL